MTPPVPSSTSGALRGTALKRRARWLEKKLADGRPGNGYDAAEYSELLWVFEALRIDFTPVDAADEDGAGPKEEPPPLDQPEEEPPPLDQPVRRRVPARDPGPVPGPPRGRRYLPGV